MSAGGCFAVVQGGHVVLEIIHAGPVIFSRWLCGICAVQEIKGFCVNVFLRPCLACSVVYLTSKRLFRVWFGWLWPCSGTKRAT